MSYKGKYNPKNPKKYVGKTAPTYRSAWELKAMVFFDTDDRILQWASEPFAIEYVCQVRKTKHRYFPDFLIKFKNASGQEEIWMVEIKPEKQSAPPKRQGKRWLQEMNVWKINESKWMAAKAYCEERGIRFVVMGETALGISR